MVRHVTRGFTLVELLVVVAIIALLLALLAPALDRAIYQAEISVCGAHQHGVALGVVSYAMANRRMYPGPRPVPISNQPSLIRGQTLSNPSFPVYNAATAGPPTEYRPLLRAAIGDLDILNCPAAGKLDFEAPADTIYTYNIFIRFQYTTGQGVINKLGDRFTFNGRSFSLLTGDRDCTIISAPPQSQSAHSDVSAGKMFNEVYNAQVYPLNNFVTTIAIWRLPNSAGRGPTDLNFAYGDGSVRRFNHVVPTTNGVNPDPRMRKLPVYHNGTVAIAANAWIIAPAE